jgi:tRNA(fMet)-specific endonuclease VapC
MIYFLDTNTCIFHLNGSAPKLSNLLEHTPPASIRIPAMVAAELIYGAEKSMKREYNLEKAKLFLSLYEIVPFDASAAQ